MNRNTFPRHTEQEPCTGRAREAHRVSTLLRELCGRVHASPCAAGRPNYPMGERLVPAALTACYGIRGQALAGFLEAQAGDGPQPPPAPDVARCLHDPALTPALAGLVAESASPLASTEQNFFVATSTLPSPGDRGRMLARVRCGAATGVVVAAEVVTAQGTWQLLSAGASTRPAASGRSAPAGRRHGPDAAGRVFSGAEADAGLRLRSERARVNLMLLMAVVHNLRAQIRAGRDRMAETGHVRRVKAGLGHTAEAGHVRIAGAGHVRTAGAEALATAA